MIYPIVIYGSDVLRKPCERITPDYPEVKKLVEDMFLTQTGLPDKSAFYDFTPARAISGRGELF